MNVRMKIQTRLDTLEAQLKAGEHLRSAERRPTRLVDTESASQVLDLFLRVQ